MLVICTSYKDAMHFKGITGIDCYGWQSEKYIPKPDEIENGTMYIVRDNDSTGIESANKIAKLYNLKIIVPMEKDVYCDIEKWSKEYLQIYYLTQM